MQGEHGLEHKIQFKMVPFVDGKKGMIVLSNGDPLKLPEGIIPMEKAIV